MTAGEGGGQLTRRWLELGSRSPVKMASAELWAVELPFVQPVATAAGVHRSRPLLFVRLLGTAGGEPVEGWGECAALADATYDEDIDRAWFALEETLLPGLGELVEAGGGILPRLATLTELRASAPDGRMAFAALEMAVADAHLRADGRSLADVLDVAGTSVAVGAVVGKAPSEDELVHRVIALAEQGYRRVKLKIGPGWDVAPLEAVSTALSRGVWAGGSTNRSVPEGSPWVRLQADANGAYTEDDEDHLAELDRFDLLCLEQPYGREDLDAHARLAVRLQTPVCLDETVGSRENLVRALEVKAASVVCLKPARLGGVGEALAVVEHCVSTGVPLWMGGMFESGYARSVNRTIAALHGFRWPGDLSPARSYLTVDPAPPPELVRDGPDGVLAARLSRALGMSEPPSLETVSTLAVRHVRFSRP